MDKRVQTWLEIAENDLEFAEQILANKQRPYFACNECHQTVEKILKAIIQNKTGERPPRIHNLDTLAKLTGLNFPDNHREFLLRLNPHYMATKYPHDLVKFYQQYTQEYSEKLFQETKELFLWLKNCLIQKK